MPLQICFIDFSNVISQNISNSCGKFPIFKKRRFAMTLLEIIQVQNSHLKAYFSDLDLLPDMEKARSCPGRLS